MVVLVIVAGMVRAFGTVNAKISEKFLLFSGTTIRSKNIKCASGYPIMCGKKMELLARFMLLFFPPLAM